jgi:hypothetical protein
MSTVKHQASFKVHQSAEVLFPLFSAEGETHWVPGWDYENVMGGTDLHEDYVFLTAGHHRSNQHEAGHDVHGHDQHGHHAKSAHHGSGHDAHGHHSPEEHAVPKTIWLVKRHEPENYLVQFYRVEPEDKVAIITVQCKPLAEDQTEVEVAYEYIGISKKGNDFVAHYSAEAHEEFISPWSKLLTHYFDAKSTFLNT